MYGIFIMMTIQYLDTCPDGKPATQGIHWNNACIYQALTSSLDLFKIKRYAKTSKYFPSRNRTNTYPGWLWNPDLTGSDLEPPPLLLNGVLISSDIGDVLVKGGVFVHVSILFTLCLFPVPCMDFIKVVHKSLPFCLMHANALCV